MWLEVSEGQGEGGSGRILENFWLGFPKRLRQRAASNKNAISQGAGGMSTDRMSGSQQDRCFGKLNPTPGQGNSKASVPPALLQIAQQQRNWRNALWLGDVKAKGRCLSLPSKSKCCAATREAPGKPLSHEGVLRKPGGRAERPGSAIRHTRGAQERVTNGKC